ncbi:MAG TPA: glycosyltransferase family 4 protein, partial [Candidatus Methylomirabilis sp.]
MRPRRALLLTNDFPPLSGGIAGYLYGLWSHLPREQTVILAPKIEGWRAFDRTHDLRIYRRSYFWSLPFPLDKAARILLPLFYLQSILRRERIDILHCGHVLTAGIVGLILKRLLRMPYAVYAYGADLLDYERYRTLARLQRRVLQEAEGVVTIGDYSVDLLRNLGVPADRIVKVLMGIDTARFRPDLSGQVVRDRHKLGQRPVLLTVARLVARKGHDMVIQALPAIRKTVPGVAYVIVGSGPERMRLEQLAAELQLENVVFFAGFVPEADLPEYYAAADCVVLCSRQIGTDVEGAGNVTLEASASGRPVIVGQSGGTREHVRHNETGLLVDPTDPRAIADAAIALLQDRDMALRLGRQGRRMIEEEFVWEKTAAPLSRLL